MPNDPIPAAAVEDLDQIALRAAVKAYDEAPFHPVTAAIRAYLSALPHLATPAGDVAEIIDGLAREPDIGSALAKAVAAIEAIGAEYDEVKRQHVRILGNCLDLTAERDEARYTVGLHERAMERMMRRHDRERDALAKRLLEAHEAIDQAIDDMGTAGHSVAESTKAKLRYELGDVQSDPPAYTYEAALRTLIVCDEAHGKPSGLRAELAALAQASAPETGGAS